MIYQILLVISVCINVLLIYGFAAATISKMDQFTMNLYKRKHFTMPLKLLDKKFHEKDHTYYSKKLCKTYRNRLMKIHKEYIESTNNIMKDDDYTVN